MTQQIRRKFTPQEKVAILRQHLLEGKPVSDVCDSHGLKPSLFYRWRKAFFENGAAAFEKTDRRTAQAQQRRTAELEARLKKKDNVIAEIMNRKNPVHAESRHLIDIAVESWRFSRLFAKVVSKLDAGESGRYANHLRYFQKKVEESLDSSGLKLVNVEGQLYDAGMAASALNLGDFGPDDVLLVDQMVEPIIMGPNGLRKQGTVMLRKVEA